MKSLARGQLLFVYGTLRRESSHPLAQRLASTSEYMGVAKIPGNLYWTGDEFPGLIPEEVDADVVGDLYQLDDPALLDVIDVYEGSFYERKRLPVESPVAGPAAAWMYIYLGAVDPARRIEQGDFMAALRARETQAASAVAGAEVDRA